MSFICYKYATIFFSLLEILLKDDIAVMKKLPNLKAEQNLDYFYPHFIQEIMQSCFQENFVM